MEAAENTTQSASMDGSPPQNLSKNSRKKLLKLQKFEAKKAVKKAAVKEQKKREAERKRKEWEEKLASVSEEEKKQLLESRKGLRKERIQKTLEERERKIQRLNVAKERGLNIIVDLDFSNLMTPSEIKSLVHQVKLRYSQTPSSI